MNINQLMQLALDLAGLDGIPGDSDIYVGGENIQRVLMGIDIGVAELKVAKDMGYDAVIAHHPCGRNSVSRFHHVLDRHIDQMTSAGVPQDVAEKAISRLKEANQLSAHSANLDHTASFARLLEMPFLNIHTPLDELGRKAMHDTIQASLTADSTVQDVIQSLNELSTFQEALTRIELRLGDPSNKAGKVVVAHGAGTNGGYEVAKAYFEHGVDTVVYIHVHYDQLLKLRNEFEGKGKNLIVTGHISSDVLGIRPYVDLLKQKGLDVTLVSGIY